jgi:hypothetical protein
MNESTINCFVKIGNALQKAFDECGVESITPLGKDMFMGYKNGDFILYQCDIKTKENKE